MADQNLTSELVVVIRRATSRIPRHTHATKISCEPCAEKIAAAVADHLERTSRRVESDLLAPAEVTRLRSLLASMPYGGSLSFKSRRTLLRDPEIPSVSDLLDDVESLRDSLRRVAAADQERESELRRYQEWHRSVQELAGSIAEIPPMLDATTIAEVEG